MRRVFQDFDGKIKTYEWIGPGRVVRYPELGGKFTTSTVWLDRSTKLNVTIPDTAWVILSIRFVDVNDTPKEVIMEEITQLIPSKVRISKRIEYEVVWKKEIDGKKIVGLCRYGTKQIVLKLGENDSETFSTFIHEIIHAIDETYKIGLSHAQVYALEKALYNLIRLNP